MFADEEMRHIPCLVPFRFAGHVVVNHFSVDTEVFEADVLYFPLFVVAGNDGEFGVRPVVGDVFEEDVFDSPARCCAIFLVEADTQGDQLALTEVFDADIFKTHVADKVVVAGIDGHAALIIYLFLFLIQDVDVRIAYVFYHVAIGHVAMQPDKDRMCHVCPKCGVLHGDVPAAARETFAGGIYRGAVIRCAAEDAIVMHVVAGKHVHSVAPAVGADGFDVVYGYAVRTTYGALRGDDSFHFYVI